MKRLFCITIAALLLLCSCSDTEPLADCTAASERAVWGKRIYSIQSIPDKGSFLAYTEIGDEEENVYIGCVDPLCSHDREECIAYSNTPRGPVAIVPKQKGCTIYYLRDESGMVDPSDPSNGRAALSKLIALDMQNGKVNVVTSFPCYADMIDTFLVTDSYVYFTFNSVLMQTESDVQSVNIWRAPLTGGELEQCTFAEDIKSGYRMVDYEDGVFYYRRGDTLCSTADDFATETVIKEELNLLWRIEIHDGWVYYTDEREVISLTPDEPKPEDRKVYRYAIGEYPEALDAANTCTLMRTKLDGSDATETLVSGISTSADWCIVEDTLYCVPAQFELQGKIDWSNSVSKNALTYIWSESGGELWAVDLITKEKKTVLSDLGYDIKTIEYTGKGKFLISGEVYDMDAINKYYETNDINSSGLKYTVWELLDIE